jgi:hypothetical protein
VRRLTDDGSMKLVALAAYMLLALGLLALPACGGNDGEASADPRPASDEKATPGYAATPRKALEAWVAAVQAGDVEMICRLLPPRDGCSTSLVRTSVFPRVREEMQGLTGALHYGAVNVANGYTLFGVVSGDSAEAYSVPVARGMQQWSVRKESAARIVLDRPDPAIALASGPTEISFTTWAPMGSGYPITALWIDSRRVKVRRNVLGPLKDGLTRAHWTAAARLLPGRHVLVAGVRGHGALEARAWVVTVR